MQTEYTGLPVFLAVAIEGLVSHLIDEYMCYNKVVQKASSLHETNMQECKNYISQFSLLGATLKVNILRKNLDYSFKENKIYVTQVQVPQETN